MSRSHKLGRMGSWGSQEADRRHASETTVTKLNADLDRELGVWTLSASESLRVKARLIGRLTNYICCNAQERKEIRSALFASAPISV